MKKYPKSFKQRCVSGVKKRLKDHGLMKSIRLVADFEGIPAKSVEAWWYAWKKAEAEKSAADFGVVYPLAGTKKNEPCTMDFPEPVGDRPASPGPAVAPPAPPVPPHVESDAGLLRCSRCSSTSHLRQLEDGGYYCDVCQIHLPFEPVEDYEMKYTESPYRKLHWMM